VVLVTGELLVSASPVADGALTRSQVDAEQKPMSYTQVFQLLPDGAGSYYVFNDVFRLVYAAS
jgi:hypothetical protein